ncbi:acylphosphatase [Microbulbifer sediminum]|uniref:acylphosphatase n=1 Tax=Microbulbifer sediminum TaxID=2904250 RepID=UPI001F3CA0D9|nr:acylphosphatase [Microbulbifer sediminum]
MFDHVPVGTDKLFEVENDFSESPLMEREGDIATALISAEAERQNFEVKRYKKLVYDVLYNNNRVTFLQNSPENSAVYSYCARQKHIAKELMARQGVPVPEGKVFEDVEAAWNYIESCDAGMVLKPLDRAYGSGVTTDVRTREHFLEAWGYAREYGREVLVEKCIKGYDLRVVVVGGQAIAALSRIPAHVIGDGQSTIQELVDRKNLQREKNPSLQIDLITRFDLLKHNGRSLDDVPGKGEYVQLTSVANTSAGGDAVQLLHLVPQEVVKIAEKAARCFPGLTQTGVDLMVDDRGDEVLSHVIEINSNPGICDAVFPSYGSPVNVPGKLLRHVFSTARRERADITEGGVVPASPYVFAPRLRVRATGESEQVAYIEQAAILANLSVSHISPYVFEVSDGTGEVLFYQGMPDRTNIISRKVSRDRKWLKEILSEAGLDNSGPRTDTRQLCQYRLIVINGKVVAGIDGGAYTGEGNTAGKYVDQRRDITESIHPGFVKAALEGVKATFSPYFAGVDVLAEDIELSPGEQSWQVLDVMCNPNFVLHHYPSEGVGRDIAGALLRSLFPNADWGCTTDRCVYVVVKGRVQGVGYRDWVQREAVRHGVQGWVRNLPHGDVEIFLNGPPAAVASLLTLCEEGPVRARVSEISVKEYGPMNQRAFLVYR